MNCEMCDSECAIKYPDGHIMCEKCGGFPPHTKEYPEGWDAQDIYHYNSVEWILEANRQVSLRIEEEEPNEAQLLSPAFYEKRRKESEEYWAGKRPFVEWVGA